MTIDENGKPEPTTGRPSGVTYEVQTWGRGDQLGIWRMVDGQAVEQIGFVGYPWEHLRGICSALADAYALGRETFQQEEEPMTIDHRARFHLDHPSVTIEEIDEQRALGWPDFDPEDYCHRCGGKNPTSWYVDSDRWNMAFPDNSDAPYNGIVCPGCFVFLHERATGMWVTWSLQPAGDGGFRWFE